MEHKENAPQTRGESQVVIDRYARSLLKGFATYRNRRMFASEDERNVLKRAILNGARGHYRPFSLVTGRGELYSPSVVLNNGIAITILYCPGDWDPEDREAFDRIRREHPALDLRVVILKMLQEELGDLEGVVWAVGEIPQEWATEATRLERIASLNAAPRLPRIKAVAESAK